jgi:hypothetical protein
VVLAIGHALRVHEALSLSDALSGFLEVVHRLFEYGVFVGHDKSIPVGILRPPYWFTFPREHEDIDFSYGLFVDGGRVASFAEGRIGYREWSRRSGRLADIHSLEDRYDHDIDELMA